MRDARAREWDTWTAESRDEVLMPDGSTVIEWTEVTDEADDTVSFCTHYEFSDGLQLESTATLRFRGEGELTQSLNEAGFVVEQIFGGWVANQLVTPTANCWLSPGSNDSPTLTDCVLDPNGCRLRSVSSFGPRTLPTLVTPTPSPLTTSQLLPTYRELTSAGSFDARSVRPRTPTC